jgi:hypothetical protein
MFGLIAGGVWQRRWRWCWQHDADGKKKSLVAFTESDSADLELAQS